MARCAQTRNDSSPGPLAGAALSSAALFAVLAAGVVAEASTGGAALSLALFAGGTAIMLQALRHYPHRSFGLCNAVTHLRLALTCAVAAALLSPGPTETAAWWLLALSVAVLKLDGLDGWLARRTGLVSEFGARFDMEVDTFLTVVLSILAVETGKAGIWILAIGLIRYAFVAAGRVWPVLAAPLPPSPRRKAVCVLQVGALTLMAAPVVTPPHSALIGAAALALVVWSFIRDVRWLAEVSPAAWSFAGTAERSGSRGTASRHPRSIPRA